MILETPRHSLDWLAIVAGDGGSLVGHLQAIVECDHRQQKSQETNGHKENIPHLEAKYKTKR